MNSMCLLGVIFDWFPRILRILTILWIMHNNYFTEGESGLVHLEGSRIRMWPGVVWLRSLSHALNSSSVHSSAVCGESPPRAPCYRPLCPPQVLAVRYHHPCSFSARYEYFCRVDCEMKLPLKLYEQLCLILLVCIQLAKQFIWGFP